MTDLSIRIAMALTVLVAIVNAMMFYGWVSAMWWLLGALPFGVLTIAAFWLGGTLGDAHRGGMACTLLLCALAWPLAILPALAFVGLACVVIVAPRGRWRALLVVPSTVSMVVIVALGEPWTWSSKYQALTYGLAVGHAVLVAIPTLLYACSTKKTGDR